MIEVNVIKEIYKGHFQVILDFPEKQDILKVLDLSYNYVWGINHIENSLNWQIYSHTLFEKEVPGLKVMVRNLKLEYLLPTSEFITLIPEIKQSITIIQTNIQPPYYLELNRLEGKSKYDMLRNKMDYLFELDMPGATDYCPLISSERMFLEKVLNRFINQ